LVRHFIEEPRACSYLPKLKAALEYRLMVDVTPAELEALMLRGWRRFGPAYFRPACAACTECVSIRIDVHRFAPSPSQQRALRRSHGRRLPGHSACAMVDGKYSAACRGERTDRDIERDYERERNRKRERQRERERERQRARKRKRERGRERKRER
jgi:arginine-tRNA-protein transferase